MPDDEVPSQAQGNPESGEPPVGGEKEAELGLEDPPPQTTKVVTVLTPEPPSKPVTMTLPPTLGRADQVKALERRHDEVMRTREYEHEANLQTAELHHRSRMQRLVLGLIMSVLLAVFALVLVAVWNHGVSPEFGLELSRLIVPSLVGSAATIVGAMFISGGGGGGKK
jgi:hypothetical protein